MDAARPVVGDFLHDGHPERFLPPQQSTVDAEQEGGHQNLRILKGFSEGHVEARRHDGISVHKQQEVSRSDARPGVESWPTPAHRRCGAIVVRVPRREGNDALSDKRAASWRCGLHFKCVVCATDVGYTSKYKYFFRIAAGGALI